MGVNASDKESVFENQLKMKDIQLHFNTKPQFMSIPTAGHLKEVFLLVLISKLEKKQLLISMII